MEVLHLPGYTDQEKCGIAQKFLVPKKIAEHGLTKKNIEISEKALERIIKDFTREAGVRNLEREIATICRKVVKMGKEVICLKVLPLSIVYANPWWLIAVEKRSLGFTPTLYQLYII